MYFKWRNVFYQCINRMKKQAKKKVEDTQNMSKAYWKIEG